MAVDRDGVDRAFVAELIEAAVAAYRPAGRFARLFARGKLSGDPLFATLLESGAICDASCLVDLGCGQGLLAVWLKVAYDRWRAQPGTDSPLPWPSLWPAPPKVGTYLGVDRSRGDIARARRAMPTYARVFRGDIRTVGMKMLDRCDVVTLIDVLQYLDFGAQERLVGALATSLPPWGTVVLRVGDGATLASGWSDVVDLVICACRGHPRWRLHRRPLSGWRTLLEGHGFAVEVIDDGRMGRPEANDRTSAGSFANVLLRASRTDEAVRATAGPLAREAVR